MGVAQLSIFGERGEVSREASNLGSVFVFLAMVFVTSSSLRWTKSRQGFVPKFRNRPHWKHPSQF